MHHYSQKLVLCDILQIQVLESGLHLHGQLAPSGVQPLHRRLQERFAQLKQGLRDLGPMTSRSRGKSQSESSQATSIVKWVLEWLCTLVTESLLLKQMIISRNIAINNKWLCLKWNLEYSNAEVEVMGFQSFTLFP